MNFKILLTLPLASFLLSGCADDSTNEINSLETVPENVTYTQNIKPIIQNNCLFCHKNPPINGAPMPLTEAEFVRQAIQDRGLLDRISRPQGASGMMPNGGIRLPQVKIETIKKWRDQGFQN
jgi:uncharacterized membrane protein